MRLRYLIGIALLLPLVGTSERACGSSGEFSLREVTSANERINSFKHAFQLLDGQVQSLSDQSFDDPYVDFTGTSAYPAPLPDDSAGSAAHHGFAVSVSGQVEIPTAGTWSFAVSAHNHAMLSINGRVIRAGGAGSATHVKPITFSQPGVYTMSMTDFGQKEPSKLELYSSPGKFHRFHARRSAFQLVGDAGNGGLALVGSESDSTGGNVGSINNTTPLVFSSGESISTDTTANTTGALNTNGQVWEGGSTYDWKINDLNGTAGSADGWDEINMSALTVSSASAATPVTIALQSLNGTAAGTPSGSTDASGGTQNLVIAHSDTPVVVNGAQQPTGSLLSSGLFALDTSGFTVNGSSVPTSDFQLELVADGAGDDLQLSYTPSPEPGVALLASAGVFPLLVPRRRRSRDGSVKARM